MFAENSHTIDLDKLNSGDPLSLDNLIFRDEAKELKRKILLSRENGNASCYFISGARGAGKSTFLNALQEDLNRHPHFEHLFHIDPSALDENEHFFFYFISRLLHYIDNNVPEAKSQTGDTDIYASLGKMAEGLLALSHPMMKDTDFVDAELYLENAVKRCNSSTALKKEFAHLMNALRIAVCAQNRGNNSSREVQFFITIDDADLNSAKCYEITECIRKYMLCEHLFFIFTGDLKLYSMVIRGNQMDHFTRQAWQYDSRGKEARFEMLESIGTQYLLKMFPIENRLHLPSPKRIFNENEPSNFTWKMENKRVIAPVLRCVHRFLKSAVGRDNVSLWQGLIEDLPLRASLQLLGYFYRNIKEIRASGTNEEHLAAQSIMLVFSSVFHLHGIESESIHNDNLQALFHTILSLMQREETYRLVEEGYSKRYQLSERIISLYLNAEIAAQTQTSARKLIWLFSLFPYLEARRAGVANLQPCFPIEPSNKHLAERESNDSDISSPYTQWGNDITAMVVAWAEKCGQSPQGVIEIPYSIAKTIISDFRINELSPYDILQQTLLRHSLCVTNTANGKRYFLSVYNFIGLMLTCIETATSHKEASSLPHRIAAVLCATAISISENQKFSPGYEMGGIPFWEKSSQNIDKHVDILHYIEAHHAHLLEDTSAWALKQQRSSHVMHPQLYSKVWQWFLSQSSSFHAPEFHPDNDMPTINIQLAAFRFSKLFEDLSRAFETSDEVGSLLESLSILHHTFLSFPLLQQLQQYSLFCEPHLICSGRRIPHRHTWRFLPFLKTFMVAMIAALLLIIGICYCLFRTFTH